MEITILAISILGYIFGGLVGIIVCRKPLYKKPTESILSPMEYILGDPGIASFLIVSLGFSGFWLSNATAKSIMLPKQNQKEELRSDRSSQPDLSSPVIDAVPLEMKP